MDMDMDKQVIDMKVTPVFEKNLKAFYETERGTNNLKYRYIINSGGSRAGKTHAILQILFLTAIQKKTNIVILMATLNQLKRTIIKSDLPPILNSFKNTINYKYNKSEQIIYFDNGSTIAFVGAEEPDRVKGIQSEILFVDETNEVNPDVLKQMFQRCTGQIFMSFNPSGSLEFIDDYIGLDNAIKIHSTYKNNPFVTEEQKQELLGFAKTDFNHYRVYALGLRGVKRESIYQHFQTVEEYPIEHKYTNYIYAMDFGFNHNPFIKIWYSPGHNKIFFETVFYGKEISTTEITDLMRLNNIDYETKIIADSANPNIIKSIRQQGYNIEGTNKHKYSVAEGINIIKGLEIYYPEDDKEIENEVINYKFKKIGGHITDIPEKRYDHIMDSLRYGITYLVSHRLTNQTTNIGKQTRKFFKF